MIERRNTTNWKSNPALLGFGVMRMPVTATGTIDREQSDQMLSVAYEAGVTYFDTAYTYHGGESEAYLGTFLKRYPRESYQVASKLPHWNVETIDDVKRIFAEQFERLDLSYIDFYLLHSIGKKTFEKLVAVGALDYLIEQQKRGKIIHLGFSFHQVYEDFSYILNYRDWDFCQIQYNYLDTEEQAGRAGYNLAAEKGVPLVIMEPIKGGSLVNLGDDLTTRLTALDPTQTPASWALRWVADHPNVKVILSGMSTYEQVVENIATLRKPKPLSAHEEAVLEEIATEMRERVGNSCTGCAYCVPCPHGVDIPGNFALWNKARMFESYSVVEKTWENKAFQSGRPHACTACGVCLPLCPQMIDIPSDLVAAEDELAALKGAGR